MGWNPLDVAKGAGLGFLMGGPVGAVAGGAAGGAGVGGDVDNPLKPEVNPYKEPENGFQYDMNGAVIGTKEGAQQWAQKGLDQEGRFSGQQGDFFNRAMDPNAAQAQENPFLAAHDANAQLSQQDALGMMRSAALGQTPSVAQGQLAQGLNASMAQQSAMAGSARGAAALANAQGNAAGNVMNASQQANQQSAILRAQEMDAARGAYGGMANQLRGSNLQRLGMGNAMSQFNAGQTNQQALGWGNLANQAGQNMTTALGQAQDVMKTQAATNTQQQQIKGVNYQATQDREAGVDQSKAEARAQKYKENMGMLLSLGNTAAQGAAAIKGGGGK